MIEPDFPPGVERLLRERVTSFESMEILLLLRRTVDFQWTPSQLCSATRIESGLVRQAIATLQSALLISQRMHGAETIVFYAPAASDLALAVEQLESMYEHHRPLVVSKMSAFAIERVRSGAIRAFADTFLLRRKKPNA